MPSPVRCANCGSLIPPDAPSGHCPTCLFGLASELEAEKTAARGEPFNPQERQFGDYILGRQLGSGGMGIVYEARQISLNRKVALKFIRDSQVASPTLLRRFTIEAEAAARLHHPNIVGIHEIGEVDGQPYFSMDLVEGESLRSRMAKGEFRIQAEEGSKSRGRSRQVAVARLIATTARSLHHAHERGVLHRDLKPSNILLDQNDEPHLTDFGLAKILRQTTEQDTRQNLTSTGAIAGTPSYMSPEQASSAEVTAASDIYGLGAVLYELLTGQPPFCGNTALETLKQVQEQPLRNPQSLNRLIEKDLDTICAKCLEKNPRHRFSSAEGLAEDLESWIEHKPIKARPIGALLRTAQWVKRNPVGTALIVALFLGLSGALVLLRVVNHQKKQFEMQQATLFGEKVQQLLGIWHDPKIRELTISSRDLAILDNRAPAAGHTAGRLSLGVTIHGDPISFAQQRASLFAQLESSLSKTLGKPVQLDLTLFKSDTAEDDLLAQGKADFMSVEATSYLDAKKAKPGMTAIARMNKDVTGVLVVHTNSGVIRLPQLAGKTIIFPDPGDPITVWTKARLVDAGILKKHLRSAASFIPSFQSAQTPAAARASPRVSGRAIASAVLQRQADAGPTYLRKYELERHHGLVEIDRFASTPRIFVARSDLETNFVAAFRTALCSARGDAPQERPDPPGNPSDLEESFTGAVAIDDSYFQGLREAMRKAAHFDGEPDPFSPPGAIKLRARLQPRCACQ